MEEARLRSSANQAERVLIRIPSNTTLLKEHDKTNLIGSSDSQKLDVDKLKVTFHHNLWEHTKERSPRVRRGQVHVYNNLYVTATGIPYAHGYSIGVGVQSHIFSENNA